MQLGQAPAPDRRAMQEIVRSAGDPPYALAATAALQCVACGEAHPQNEMGADAAKGSARQ